MFKHVQILIQVSMKLARQRKIKPLHRTPTDSGAFNRILILDSIPLGEFPSARHLRDDLQTLAIAVAPSPKVDYQRIETLPELRASLESCVDAAKVGVKTLIHLECHGHFDGFELSDGTVHPWATLKPALVALNIALKLELILVIAACEGGAFATAVTMSDRAPFWGLIGPTTPLSGPQLEAAFRAFYEVLLRDKSPAKAVEAMNVASAPAEFFRTTARGLFERAWQHYKSTHRHGVGLERRLVRMRERAAKENVLISDDQLLASLAVSEPRSFARFRRTYFMQDLFPEHDKRFPMRYS